MLSNLISSISTLSLLCMCFFGSAIPLTAQVTFSYLGEGYDTSWCQYHFGSSAPCVNGTTVARVTLNIRPAYTGHVTAAQIISASVTAAGAGISLDQGSCFNQNSTFDLVAGQIVGWSLQFLDVCGAWTKYINFGYDTGMQLGFDQALRNDGMGNYLAIGGASYSGHWSNPKSHGAPCCLSSVSSWFDELSEDNKPLRPSQHSPASIREPATLVLFIFLPYFSAEEGYEPK